MRIVDELFMRAPARVCFEVAADVERWPDVLSHYSRVRFLEKRGFGHGRVEMAAWRDFPMRLRYPTWWVSDMRCDVTEPAVYYRHVRGITRGMTVKWAFRPTDGGTNVSITHDWQGPAWPLIGRVAWAWVIAPHFVHVIASRTLRGVAAEAERRSPSARPRRDIDAAREDPHEPAAR